VTKQVTEGNRGEGRTIYHQENKHYNTTHKEAHQPAFRDKQKHTIGRITTQEGETTNNAFGGKPNDLRGYPSHMGTMSNSNKRAVQGSGEKKQSAP